MTNIGYVMCNITNYDIEVRRTQRGNKVSWRAVVKTWTEKGECYLEQMVCGKNKRQLIRKATRLIRKWQKNEVQHR